MYYLIVSVYQEYVWCSWIVRLRIFHKASNRVSAGTAVMPRFNWGRIHFQVHSGCQQKSVPCYFRARDPISSLSVILELLSTSFLHPQSQQQSIKFCFCFIFLIFPPVISLLPPFLPHLTSATESSGLDRTDWAHSNTPG